MTILIPSAIARVSVVDEGEVVQIALDNGLLLALHTEEAYRLVDLLHQALADPSPCPDGVAINPLTGRPVTT